MDNTKEQKMRAMLISLGSIERLKLVKDVIKNEYDVEMYISDFDHNKKCTISTKEPDCNYIHISPYKKNLSLKRILSLLSFGRKIASELKKNEPDLIYLILPPNNVVKRCNQYVKKKHSTRIVLDIYDLWPESLPVKKVSNTLPIKIWKNWRNNYIKTADQVFTECELYQDELRRQGLDQEYRTLYLCKEQNEQVRMDVETHINSDKADINDKEIIRFGYLGSINHIIDIDEICRIVSSLIYTGTRVSVDIIGAGESLNDFVSALEEAGAEVNYHGAIYDEVEKYECFREVDFGLNMMKTTVKVGLTTKSIDYLSMGIPLLNNIKHDTWNMIENEGIGINVKKTNDGMNIVKELRRTNINQMRVRTLKAYDKHFTPNSFKETVESAFIGTKILTRNT